ncbi:hypothetical protein C8R43DRAFT_950962 [Mycena crocata]|nr:hypothetical protein C8R43DRAFT_950962 [Mycena crocata]
MHPALRIQNLSILPISVRRLANAAAEGSIKHLANLTTQVVQGNPSQSILLLPVFYTILDPVMIPTLDELDKEFSQTGVVEATRRANICLGLLYQLRGIPSEVFPLLWPRMWQWICFIDMQPHWNPQGDCEFNKILLVPFLLFSRLHRHSVTRTLIHSTPGVGIVVAKIWKMSLQPGYRIFGNDAFTTVCDFLCYSKDPTGLLDELIDGTGGNIWECALLVLKHITDLISVGPHPHSEVPPKVVCLVDSMLRFLGQVEIRESHFFDVLVSQGLSRTLTNAISDLEKFDSSHTPGAIENCFILLECIFNSETGYQNLLQSLQAGLLLVIAFGRDYNRTCIAIECTSRVLHHNFPAATVYYPVLHQMKASLDDDFPASEDFEEELTKSGLYLPWQALVQLARERIQLLDCDWKEGGHRRICPNLRGMRLQDTTNLITTRDRSFMRALLHDDYEAATEDILLAQIAFLRQNPGQPFITLFDYAEGPVTFTVEPAKNALCGTEFSNLVSYDKARGSRVEVHLMVVRQGLFNITRIFSMHSSSSRIREELGRIAMSREMELHQCPSDIRGEIETLVEEQVKSVVYIH